MYLILFVVLIFLSLFSFLAAQTRQKEDDTLAVVLNLLLCTGWLTAAVHIIKQI